MAEQVLHSHAHCRTRLGTRRTALRSSPLYRGRLLCDAASSPPALDPVMLVVDAATRHSDVVARVQLIGSEAHVRRALIVPAPPPMGLRPLRSLRHREAWIDQHVDALLGKLRASVADDTSVEALARASALIIVARTPALWWLGPRLGWFVRHLLRRTHTSLLLAAGRRPRRYRRVVIATDLRTDMEEALCVVSRVAPAASITFLNVYRGLMEGKLQWAGVSPEHIVNHRLSAQREAISNMAMLLGKHELGSASSALLAYGWPVVDIVSRARDLRADLLVVSRSTRSWWAEALGASVSLEVARRADCDVLVVHQRTRQDKPRHTALTM